VREALAMRDRAAQELEAARRNARLSAKQAWFTWCASAVREASAKQTMRSAGLALSGAQSARARGVKADIDVLQAEQQHATALRDWRKARYDAIISQFKLKAACGQLAKEELVTLDGSLSY
jgi:outer membrane protein